MTKKMTKKQLNAIDRHVGAQLRNIRLLRGISQETLAKAIDLTFQQIQKYERGANRISASRMYQIAGILQIDPLLFFDGLNKPAQIPLPKCDRHSAELFLYYRSIPPHARRRVIDTLKALTGPAPK